MGSKARLVLKLNEHIDLFYAAHQIRNLYYPDENTNTSGGLYIARTQLFNLQNGDRPNAPNVAIVITDGESTYDRHKTIPHAQALRSEGVRVIGVGVVTSYTMEAELKGISSYPHVNGSDYFLVLTFSELYRLIDPLLLNIYRACIPTTSFTTPSTPSSTIYYTLSKIASTVQVTRKMSTSWRMSSLRTRKMLKSTSRSRSSSRYPFLTSAATYLPIDPDHVTFSSAVPSVSTSKYFNQQRNFPSKLLTFLPIINKLGHKLLRYNLMF